jgi:hypothetical protein
MGEDGVWVWGWDTLDRELFSKMSSGVFKVGRISHVPQVVPHPRARLQPPRRGHSVATPTVWETSPPPAEPHPPTGP